MDEANIYNAIFSKSRDVKSFLHAIESCVVVPMKSRFYGQKDIKRCLVQKIYQGRTGAFFGNDFFELKEAYLSKNDIKFKKSDKNTVKLILLYRFKLLIQFHGRTFLYLLQVIFELLKKKEIYERKISIVENLSLRSFLGDAFIEKFNSFLKSCNAFNYKDSFFLIYCEREYDRSKLGRTCYRDNPQIAVVREVNNKKKFLKEYVKSLYYSYWEFLRLFHSNNLFLLLERDYALTPLFQSLSEEKTLNEVYISNSHIFQQDLYYSLKDRNYRVTMVWYSTNGRPHYYKLSKEKESLFYFDYIKADRHLVWNEFEAKWCEDNFRGEFETKAIGPIMFTPLPKQIQKEVSDSLRIMIFDVSPYKENVWESLYSNKSFNYYSYKITQSFYEDILAVGLELGVEVKFFSKIKRKLSPSHDERYKSLLSRLSKNIKFYSETESIYEILRKSDIVLVSPYSSPAYISEKYEIPCAFYDPTSLLEDEGYSVPLVAGKNELSLFMKKNIQQLL